MNNNQTPPTILRNLYAKLETMEKELNENSSNQGMTEKPVGPQMSPLTLPTSNTNNTSDVKKSYNTVVDKMSKLNMNDSHIANYGNGTNSPIYHESDYIKVQTQRGRGGSYSDKENDYNSPKINYIRAAPTPPAINTYYNPHQRYMRTEDDTFNNLESPQPYEVDGKYYGNYQPQYVPYDKMNSPNGNSFAFSPDSATFYSEMSIPNIDEYGNYVSDYKHQSDFSGKDYYMQQRQSDFSKSSINNSFDLNADLDNHARSFAGTDSINESFSDSKSFLAAAAEIDMTFDPSILSGKKPKYMKDLVNSNNFHKGGQMTICTNILFNKKKTLFYALTTHRLYAFKEDRSDAELITHYTIDKDTKVNKAGIYAGVCNFELSTKRNNDKQKDIYEFECASKEEKEDWLHSINKVIQLHKYHDKTLPPAPDGTKKKEESYTSTLKTPNLKQASFSTPSMSPEVSPSNYYSNSSFSSSYKSPITPPGQYNISNSSFSKVSPMYSAQAAQRRNSPQPIPSPSKQMKSSPGMMAAQPVVSPGYNGGYMNRTPPKNLPINQLINNTPPIQTRNPQQSPRVNYYQRSPMQRPQGN